MTRENLDVLYKYIREQINLDKVEIDFINFNGTNTLERLVDKLRKSSPKFEIQDRTVDVKIGEVKYVHSKLEGKTQNYHEYAFGTTRENVLAGCPTSILNALNKTNYEFINWISDSDIFITHGLSFGVSDEFYWKRICEKICENGIIIDFPYITAYEKKHPEKQEEKKKQRLRALVGDEDEELAKRVLINTLSSFKTDIGSSSIFSF